MGKNPFIDIYILSFSLCSHILQKNFEIIEKEKLKQIKANTIPPADDICIPKDSNRIGKR